MSRENFFSKSINVHARLFGTLDYLNVNKIGVHELLVYYVSMNSVLELKTASFSNKSFSGKDDEGFFQHFFLTAIYSNLL